MQIRELKEKHPAIYARALECQVEQGNEPNDQLLLEGDKSSGNFIWEKTSEGDSFWSEIYVGRFDAFYDKYPKPTPTILNTDKHSRWVDTQVVGDTLKEVSEYHLEGVKKALDEEHDLTSEDSPKHTTTTLAELFEAPAHYDNSKGSLYKVASERGWNSYLFDVVKRLERGGKKDPLEQEIKKSIFVLQLWLEEHGTDK